MGLLSNFRNRFRPPQPERVTFDEYEVVRHFGRGQTERVRWGELDVVSIITTDAGPFAEDVWWMLGADGGSRGCAIPGSATGVGELLQRLQQLPGFDEQAVIDAMGSTSTATFQCWVRA
jgi:hypothetical protein